MAEGKSTVLVFGYRSLVYRLVTAVIVYILAAYFLGIPGFLLVFLTSIFMNLDAIDMMRVSISDEMLEVRRYLNLYDFECRYYLDEIEAVVVYLRVKHGKAVYPDGSQGSTSESYYILHLVLKDGEEREILLLAMKEFEIKMLMTALAATGINDTHESFVSSR